MTSLRPHSNIRPSTIRKSSRTRGAARSTPRSGTLASVPVERLGRLRMTKSSGDASGPSAARARPGASAITCVSSPDRPLIISESAPLRSTMALSALAERAIIRRTPAAIDSTVTRTATTPAMPTTVDSEDPSRSGSVCRLIRVTAMVCSNGLRIVAPPRDRQRRRASAISSRWAWSAGTSPVTTPTKIISATPFTRSAGGR